MRVFHQQNVRGAVSYYTNLSEYYGPGSENRKGRYFGDGAALLGLEGEVDLERFAKLCQNIHPQTGERLTERNHAQRRVLTDLTFSAPKSVSVLWAFSGDERIADAVVTAALDTLREIEQDAMTRVNHSRGVMTLEKTRNVVGAAWLHSLARPVDGHPDMQLHVHGTIVNATHTGDGRWTAVDLSAVVRDSGYWNAVFQSRLASHVQQLGYAVDRHSRNFEIRGVSRGIIDKFSRRTAVIDRKAAELGITSKDAKDALAATTREHKTALSFTGDALAATWHQRLSEAEACQLQAITPRPDAVPTVSSARQAVDFATHHRFQTESTTRERHLARDALLRGLGGATVDEIRSEIRCRDWIREGEEEQTILSTREILAEEQAIVAFARSGRGQSSPLAADHVITRDWLSDEQQQAVLALLASSDRLQILRGAAGVGKTTLMREAIEAIEQTGTPVAILAPTNDAAHGVLHDQEGFDAATLDAFLNDRDAQARATGGVIWIDEAGLVGTENMARLARVAETIDARIILAGDKRQHKSVARGATLRLLETEAGIRPLEVRRIRRQTDAGYREAVSLLSQGHIAEGFDKLDQLGYVHEMTDDAERVRHIARDYADARDAGLDTLVIAPAHAEREQITGAIRDELKARGHLHHDERDFTILKSRRLSDAQKSDPVHYTPGEDIIEFHRRAKGGWTSGSRAVVTAVENGRVLALGDHGLKEIPLDAAGSFDVYRAQTARFAAGDLLRITRNRQPTRGENTKRLNNGSLVMLKAFTPDGKLSLGNGQIIGPDWGHVEYGTTVTSYASQGKTFDRVILAQSALSYPASSPEQAYVSASRGKLRLDWYTDSIGELRHAIQHTRPAKMASELRPAATGPAPATPAHSHTASLAERARRFAADQLERFRHWISTPRRELAR